MPDISEPAPDGLPFRPWRGRITLLLGVHVVGTAGYMAVMAMAPVIRSDLDLTAKDFGLFMSAFFASQVITALPSGVVTDRFGVGWTLFSSMVLMAIGAVMFAATASFIPGLAAMFLMGLGYSLVNPATAKGVLNWYRRERRATAMGVKQFGVPVGGVVGAGGGIAAAFIDWRIVLLVVAAASLVTGCFWLVFARRPRWDGRGLGGVAADLRIVLGRRPLHIICLSNVAFSIGQSTMFAYLTLFLRDAALLSQSLASIGAGLAQAASAGGRIGFSYMSDALFGGRRKWMIVALTATGGLTFCLAMTAGPEWPTTALLLLSIAMGGTTASYAALLLSMTVESVDARLSGSAIGFNALAWSLGGTIGPPLFGWVLDATGSYGSAWIAIGAIQLVGAAFMAATFREQSEN
jgi:predicted MFS family arabinose efflux permease